MKLFLFFLLLLSSKAGAEGHVSSFLSSKKIQVTLKKNILVEQVIIISHDTKQAVAFGHISKRISGKEVQVYITEILDGSLVLPNDLVYPLDYKILKKKKVPGLAALTLTGKNCLNCPAKYKELAYFGALTAEGHTLEKGEFLASPFQVQYGITNRFGLRIINALWFDEYLNLGAKYQVLKNKYTKITLNSFAAHNTARREWLYQVGGIISMPQNSKHQNHISANFRLDPEAARQEGTPISRGIAIFQDSDIRNITEYVTDKWHRILFGPVYNVELQSFGGTFSYMWIWDTFHMSLGFATRDFTELKVGTEGYYAVYDIFWRF